MRDVIRQLETLRRRSWLMLVAQRASTILAWMLAIVLAMILLDWLLRLPSGFRLALLVSGMAGLGYAVWRYLQPAVTFWPSLTDLALRVERFIPTVSGRLASSVEFATEGIDETSPLAARAVRETQTRLHGANVMDVITRKRTLRDLIAALFVVVAIGGLIALQPRAAATGLSRLLNPYGEARWPARTGVESLMDQVIATHGVHPRGQALILRAKVTKGPQDQRVDAFIRYTVDGRRQPWQHIVLTHQTGEPIHERLVDTNAEAIEVYFATEDAQTDPREIELVEPPSIARASLSIEPPSYAAGHVTPLTAELGPGTDERAVTAAASLAGSSVRLTLQTSKPLPIPRPDSEPSADSTEARDRWLSETLGWEGGELPRIEFSPAAGATARDGSPLSDQWTLEWTLRESRQLAMRLTDEHGLTNPEPIVYRIEAVNDRSPGVTITDPQADAAVLKTAIVPLAAEARDDVAVSTIGMEAVKQAAPAAKDSGGGDPATSPEQSSPTMLWSQEQAAGTALASLNLSIDVGSLDVVEGDVILVTATATDLYEIEGEAREPSRSPVRKLRIISELDLAESLRRQLGGVRQNAIRIEAAQGELQDDVIDHGVQPGVSRAQGSINQRIATQRQTLDEIRQSMQQNRLDDEQLDTLLSQASDLLDFAGRAANQAVGQMEARDAARSPAPSRDDASADEIPDASNQQQQPGRPSDSQRGQPGSERPGSEQPNSASNQPSQQPPGASRPGQAMPDQPASGRTGAGARQPGQQDDAAQRGDEQPEAEAEADDRSMIEQWREELDLREAAPEDKPIVEAQQQVRDELTDLIKLLDRDEDTWVITRQIEQLLQEQKRLEGETADIAQHTLGRSVDELSPEDRSELDRIAQKQRDLREQSRQTVEQTRKQAEPLQEIDPEAASAMQRAADTAEQSELDRNMQSAAENVQQNQLQTGRANQQAARRTLERMLQELQETRRARTEELQRRLASLVESIERLITVQENELSAIQTARADAQQGNAAAFGGLDTGMIRLNQNTQSVAAEARAAGREANRIARTLDRASDAQGEAVVALREQPTRDADAETAEQHSLELLREAKAMAEELQQQVEQEQTRQQREELMEAYRQFVQQEVALREQSLELSAQDESDRRRLVEARRLGNVQDEIRRGVADLQNRSDELMQSTMFTHVHRLIDRWAQAVTESMREGDISIDVTDRQQQIADSLARLVKALEEATRPPDEFAQNQQQGSGQSGQQNGPQPLIPPVAELQLLREMQEQVYNQTRAVDSRDDLTETQRLDRLSDLGQQQRDLMELGREIIEALQRAAEGAQAGDGADPTPQ
jgi:hypothetical protein